MYNNSSLQKQYDRVTITQQDDAYQILLSDKLLHTPAGHVMSFPTLAAAELVAKEFEAQQQEIKPETMFVTRLVNTAIDGVAADVQPLYEDLLRFASYDLLLYRASYPEALVTQQQQSWDPVLEWAQEEIGAPFVVTQDLVAVTQPKETLALLGQKLKEIKDPLALTAFHTMTCLIKSTLLALALCYKQRSVEEVWQLAHLDEDWVDEQWPADEEKDALTLERRREFEAAYALFRASHERGD